MPSVEQIQIIVRSIEKLADEVGLPHLRASWQELQEVLHQLPEPSQVIWDAVVMELSPENSFLLILALTSQDPQLRNVLLRKRLNRLESYLCAEVLKVLFFFSPEEVKNNLAPLLHSSGMAAKRAAYLLARLSLHLNPSVFSLLLAEHPWDADALHNLAFLVDPRQKDQVREELTGQGLEEHAAKISVEAFLKALDQVEFAEPRNPDDMVLEPSPPDSGVVSSPNPRSVSLPATPVTVPVVPAAPEPEPEIRPESQPEPKLEPKPGPAPESKPAPKPETEPESRPEPISGLTSVPASPSLPESAPPEPAEDLSTSDLRELIPDVAPVEPVAASRRTPSPRGKGERPSGAGSMLSPASPAELLAQWPRKIIWSVVTALAVLLLAPVIYFAGPVEDVAAPKTSGPAKVPEFWVDSLTQKPVTQQFLQADNDFQMGELFLIRGQYENALSLFRDALAREPRHTFAQFREGYCLYHLGDYPRAEKALQKTLTLDEGFALVRLYLARIAVKNRNFGVAFGNYRKEYERSKDWRVGLEYAEFLMKSGRQDDAGLIATELARKYPGNYAISAALVEMRNPRGGK